MTGDAEHPDEISRLTHRLLLDAGALGRLPTPIDDIVAAGNLREASESVLSDSVLSRAPQYLRAAIAPFRFKIRALLDRREREIHLDPAIAIHGRRNFNRLHEVVHHIAPWQTDLVVVDDDVDLSPATRRLFEREANEGASLLLFQHDFIRRIAAQHRLEMASVVTIAGLFGASIRATLRAFARTHHRPVLAIALEPSPLSREPLRYRRNEVTASPSWIERFGPPKVPVVIADPPETWLRSAADLTKPAVVVGGEELRIDLAGKRRVVKYELVNTTYQVLILFWDPSG
ncbi:MAG: hypothetical protein M0Z49_14935 [Chloroflexi bacterium]|nr:hypothetical protein [Chloroflexota bacterium]MDA8237986.1 hypothetical protein [Chloroflexota bacterium]